MINTYYIQRINLAIDYIEEHLSEKITLDKLAEVAMFSKYHFHRIFKVITGDTLNNYIKRLKMEKAGKLLQTHHDTISNIASELGYRSNANFSRDFNEYYGCSPSDFRQNGSKPISRKIVFKTDLDLNFEGIKKLNGHFVMYERVATGYDTKAISKAFEKLYEYALENELLWSTSQSLGIGYDDPDYTPKDKCRYDACLSINESDISENFPFNTKKISGGNYATFLFNGEKELFADAWDIIFNQWLLSSYYIPVNKPHFEMYLPSDDYEKGILKALLCLAVKPIKT